MGMVIFVEIYLSANNAKISFQRKTRRKTKGRETDNGLDNLSLWLYEWKQLFEKKFWFIFISWLEIYHLGSYEWWLPLPKTFLIEIRVRYVSGIHEMLILLILEMKYFEFFVYSFRFSKRSDWVYLFWQTLRCVRVENVSIVTVAVSIIEVESKHQVRYSFQL